jgi:hypothetical protein
LAHRTAARHRKKGLDPTARRIVELLEQRGVRHATVLEIGRRDREIGPELLRRGAASATNLELSPGYEDEAAALIAEAGMTRRVKRGPRTPRPAGACRATPAPGLPPAPLCTSALDTAISRCPPEVRQHDVRRRQRAHA